MTSVFNVLPPLRQVLWPGRLPWSVCFRYGFGGEALGSGGDAKIVRLREHDVREPRQPRGVSSRKKQAA